MNYLTFEEYEKEVWIAEFKNRKFRIGSWQPPRPGEKENTDDFVKRIQQELLVQKNLYDMALEKVQQLGVIIE